MNHLLLFFSFADGWSVCLLSYSFIVLCVSSCSKEVSLCAAVTGMDVMHLFQSTWCFCSCYTEFYLKRPENYWQVKDATFWSSLWIAVQTSQPDIDRWYFSWHPPLACFCREAQGQMETLELRPDSVSLCCREKWCHMTQEERDDSSKIDENIAFGQLGWGSCHSVLYVLKIRRGGTWSPWFGA